MIETLQDGALDDRAAALDFLNRMDAEVQSLSRLVSGPAVYNEILRTRPELTDALHRGFFHHRRNQRHRRGSASGAGGPAKERQSLADAIGILGKTLRLMARLD